MIPFDRRSYAPVSWYIVIDVDINKAGKFLNLRVPPTDHPYRLVWFIPASRLVEDSVLASISWAEEADVVSVL